MVWIIAEFGERDSVFYSLVSFSYLSRLTRKKLTMIATTNSAVPMLSAIRTSPLSACIDRMVWAAGWIHETSGARLKSGDHRTADGEGSPGCAHRARAGFGRRCHRRRWCRSRGHAWRDGVCVADPKWSTLITLCDHLSHILLANVWHTGHITVTILAWC